MASIYGILRKYPEKKKIQVITMLVNIFSVTLPLGLKSAGGSIAYENHKEFTILLFLFVDVDLILVFAATYLPLFKPLRRRLI